MDWTDEQKRIIETRNKNILVSAAAGSGKTAVLVERIIDIIKKDNVDIDKFLVVTFTNAAASGMKQKIQKSLLKAVQGGEGNSKLLRKQINLLNKSSISTIHSFCIDVVRKNFHIIGIDPNFRIGDPNEVDILLHESLDEVLEKAYGEISHDFIKLVEGFTKNRGDSELCDIIINMYNFIQSFPEPISWLENSVNRLNVTEDTLKNSTWMVELKENISMMLEGARESLNRAKYLCENSDGPFSYFEALTEDLYNLNSLSDYLVEDFEIFLKNINYIKHPKLKPLRGENKKNCNESKQTEVKSLRDEYKKIIDSIKKLIPNKKMSQFAKELNYMFRPMSSLYNIISDLNIVFKNKKNEKAIADFNDVEHYALEILKNPEVKENYKKKYDYIFIDEYQDSNRLQEALIEHIKRKNNVFMVGDVKQSIYRFRLADPGLFNEKYNKYHSDKSYKNEFENFNDVRIDLNKNFRSRKGILDGTNYIFKNIMSEKIGEVIYSENEFLNYGAKFNEGNNKCVEIDIIDKNSEDDEDLDDEIKTMRTAEIEAKFAADKIKALLSEEIYVPDKEISRNIEYKDVVILMRSVSNWAQIFEETFNDEEIPFYYDGGGGYFDTVEIQMILNLLKIIDNIRQDIPLLSVMRSPICNFTTEELLKIRLLSPRIQYIDAVYAYKNRGNDELAKRLKNFIEKIEEWKKRGKYTDLNDFIWEILMETNYYYFVGLLPKGNMRQANLRLLTDKAFEFEKTSMRGIFNFLKFIDKLNVSSGDIGTAKIIGENDNVVRLMSVHKSKGLEFPVVLMCGTNKKFNKTDTTKNILYHNDFGIAPKYINPDERIFKETFPRIVLKNVIKVENLSEEMRILYVAMTRAVSKLIIIGTVNKTESKFKKWKKGPTQYNIYTGESFMDWMGMSLYSHKDFATLRQMFGDEDILLNNDELCSEWDINRITLSEINYEKKEKSNDKFKRINEIAEFKNKNNSSLNEEIQRRLNFLYPFQTSVNVPTKMSVTDLKILKDNKYDSIKYKIPTLRNITVFKEEDDSFTKAEIGTIVHFVMQHINIEKSLDYVGIDLQIKEMTTKKMITEKEASVVNINMLADFFKTEIGQRMIKSPTVKREIPFVIKKSARKIIRSLDENDVILLQGIIDCYFYEGDQAVIIDYKTDDVTHLDIEDIKNKYKDQILSYKEAVEKITHNKVKSCFLYLFNLAKFIEIY